MAAATTTTISLKLLVNKDSGKVLFAEAGKDLVDFLFGLLELPLGSIVALMVEHEMFPRNGSFGRIYQSVQNLSDAYLQQSQQTKASLLRPLAASTSKHTPLLKQLAYDGYTTTSNTYYGHKTTTTYCEACGEIATIYCESCDATIPLYNEDTTDCENTTPEGYVKDVVTYMVMDDLEVKPMSTISSITFLNTFGFKDVGCLQEKTGG